MDANEITFGIEIECNLPYGTIQAGAYHSGLEIPNFPPGWNAQRDGSLGPHGIEIVSPILRGSRGIREVVDVLAKLRALGARVCNRCGFHVHVGWAHGNGAELQRLTHIVAASETALYATTGTRRRAGSHFCKSIREDFQPGAFAHCSRDRYHSLNVSNLQARDPSKQTVEFRAFAGTLNATKIVGYIRLCVGLVERALEASRRSPWNMKAKATRGEGQTALRQLFYQLGWTKGRRPKVYGSLLAEGVPSIERVKKELMRLAAKFDGEAPPNAPA